MNYEYWAKRRMTRRARKTRQTERIAEAGAFPVVLMVLVLGLYVLIGDNSWGAKTFGVMFTIIGGHAMYDLLFSNTPGKKAMRRQKKRKAEGHK